MAGPSLYLQRCGIGLPDPAARVVDLDAARTFGPQRRQIWTMQSVWHSLPTINGHHQTAGRACAAGGAMLESNDDAALPTPAVDERPVDDTWFRPVWGERLFRLRQVAARPPAHGRVELRFARPAA